MAEPFRLGRLDDFADGESRSLALPAQDQSLEAFVVRQGDDLFVYRNRCPHTGAPLNWTPDQYLTLDREWIQCTLHGALFSIDQGVCVSGPCVGDHLTSLATETVDGIWYVMNWVE